MIHGCACMHPGRQPVLRSPPPSLVPLRRCSSSPTVVCHTVTNKMTSLAFPSVSGFTLHPSPLFPRLSPHSHRHPHPPRIISLTLTAPSPSPHRHAHPRRHPHRCARGAGCLAALAGAGGAARQSRHAKRGQAHAVVGRFRGGRLKASDGLDLGSI